MSLPIYYTPEAKRTLNSLCLFISEKFGERSAKRFLIKSDKVIKLISSQPFIYKSSIIHEDIRVAYLTKQFALFYQVTKNSINLLFFWDNRQDPLFVE